MSRSALPTFQNQDFLERAFTHRSALNENISPSDLSYERLEFLGDAVLELVTTEFLFHKFPDEPEGNLTNYRAALVKTTTLAEVALELQLDEEIYMSQGEDQNRGRENPGILADVFEAVLGALYLDQGVDAVDELLQKHLFPRFDEIKKKQLYRDAKSQLQEVVQSLGLGTPAYEIVHEEGPDHDKIFTSAVVIDDKRIATGTGRSKQLAEQQAAHEALPQYK